MRSLRTRLVLGTIVGVVVILSLSGWMVYRSVERDLLASIDRGLLADARLLAATVDQDGEQLDIEFAELNLGEYESTESGRFFQLEDPRDGSVLFRSPSLAGSELDSPDETLWASLPGGGRVRSVAVEFVPRQEGSGAERPHPLRLVLASDAGEVRRTLAALARILLAVACALVVVVPTVLFLIVERSLRPVWVSSLRVASIDAEALGVRLPVGSVPTELEVFVHRVNDMLARLDAAFARERAFSMEVAHELRTPLAGLRNLLEVSQARGREPGESSAQLGRALRVVVELERLIERLLQLARLEIGGAASDVPEYDLAEFVTECWEPLVGPATRRDLRVSFELDESARVRADPELLRLALRNLLDNAVEYADRCGDVGVATRTRQGRAVIEVSNSGSRLGADEALAATRRFWRGDGARTSGRGSNGHSGLGLALVQRAIQACSGRLELNSRPGGRFVARLDVPLARTSTVSAGLGSSPASRADPSASTSRT